MFKKILLTLAIQTIVFASETNYSVSGKITNITTIKEGLLIRIRNGEVPRACLSSDKKWMIVEQSDTTMVAVAMTAWTMGRNATLHSDGTTSTDNYCIINQIDPSEN